jgi:outer membrane protein assembly factor BamB/endogenous inhibitor of DNA gyrase (YacG/DUF329 family)
VSRVSSEVLDRVVACPTCGAAARDDAGPWCGSCGALLDADRWLDGRAPVGDDAGTTAGDVAPVDEQRVGRGRRWAVAAGAVVVALVLAVAVAGDEQPAPSTAAAGVATTLGRLDDATGRSSTGEPPLELVRRWTAASDVTPFDMGEILVWPLGGGRVVVGDRVLSLRDGTVLGSSESALELPWSSPAGPGSRSGWVDGGRVVLVDTLDGAVVDEIAVEGLTDLGFVAGWAGPDVVVVLHWPTGDLGEVVGVDVATGERRWTSGIDLWSNVGDGWFLGDRRGQAFPTAVLLDGSTGATVPFPPPSVDADVQAALPVVAGGRAFALGAQGLWAWDVTSGRLLWSEPTVLPPADLAAAGDALQVVDVADGGGRTVRWFDAATGELEREETVEGPERAADTSWPTLSPGTLPGAVAFPSPVGVRLVERDGPGWEVELADVVSVTSVDDGEGHVVAVTGTLALGGDGVPERFLGETRAVVFDRQGRELFRVPVRPAETWLPAPTLAAVVGGHAVVAQPAPGTVRELRAVALEDGASTFATRVLSGSLDDGVDVNDALLLGTMAGGPGAGGASPLLWWEERNEVLAAGAELPLGPLPSPVDDRRPSVVAGGHLAVPTQQGAALVRLPTAGEGVSVDRAVRHAVGAPVPSGDAVTERAVPAARALPGVTPVAGVGGRLLGVEEVADPAGRAPRRGRLLAVDPATAEVVWRSALELRPDAGRGPFRSGDRLHGWEVRALVHDAGTPVVVLLGDAVVALDPDDGRERWRTATPRGGADDAVLVGGAVVVPTPDGARALDVTTGRVVWTADVGDLVTAVDGAGDRVLVATAGGTVVQLDGRGVVVDRTVSDPGRIDDLGVVDGLLVVVHRDGRVVGFGPRPEEPARDDRVDVPSGGP